MKDIIVNRILQKKRNSKAEKQGVSEFKDKIKVGKRIEFSWWSFYGSGKATRIIKDIGYNGKPCVRFNGYGSWLIEFHEIIDIY